MIMVKVGRELIMEDKAGEELSQVNARIGMRGQDELVS